MEGLTPTPNCASDSVTLLPAHDILCTVQGESLVVIPRLFAAIVLHAICTAKTCLI